MPVRRKVLDAVLDSMSDGVVAADTNGKFILWNRAADEIVGIGAADLPHESWAAHYGVFGEDGKTPIPPDELAMVRSIRGESVDGQVQFIRNAARPEGVWIRVNARPMRDDGGTLMGGVIVFRDITAQRQKRARMREAKEELEAFAYSVSHDLRAPLRAMSGFAEALAEDYGGKLDAAGFDYVRRIREAAKRMGDLIEDLLGFSRISRTRMQRGRVDLSALADSVLADLRRADPARSPRTTVAPGIEVDGDSELLRVALGNLLGNAWKFTACRDPGEIEFGVQDGKGERVYFVRDDGAGFDMAYAGRLFTPFQRLHSTAEYPGTGIGLATVRRVIARHAGRVWAEAEEGRGATFHFTLGEGG